MKSEGFSMQITENQLDEWVRANSREAQGMVVELVWRLLAASCPKPLERRFPLTDSIGQHGPDGFLNVELSFDPFVPEGRSYWEIGTGLDARGKATDDYRDLTKTVPEIIRRDTTFLFVTPLSGRRNWEFSWKEDAQAAWLDERRKKEEWKDVRIIDGTILIDWVNQFLSVEFWLAQKMMGIEIEQINTLSQHWEVLISFGEPPPLIPDLFLANRIEACSKIKEVFNGTSNQLKITTHYPDQVVDFVSAYLASLDDDSRIDADGRCLIVGGPEGWNTICTNHQWKNHILIADASLDLNGDSGAKLIQKARRAGHAIIFGGLHGGIPDPTSVSLPMVRTHQIQEALVKAGYREERARVLAQKSAGNISSLLRCLQNLSVLPEWAEDSDAAELAIALLLGSWNETSDADRSTVENILGKAYGEWIGIIREFALRRATPLIQRESKWKFIPRYEGWYALGPQLYDELLDRLKAAAISVFQEKDPKFELPSEERFAASIHGKVLSHSESLRQGLADTLALLGSHPQALTSCSLGKAQRIATLILHEIFNDADWIQWASLNDILPLLAEAAPREFLDAVEKALLKTPCPFDEIFAQEGDSIFGGNYMTGLLWALETIAWDTNYLGQAVLCLGELATRDPGGQSGNRPANSLNTIFLPWIPQTCAPAGNRVAAIRTLLNEFPDIGWKLLVSLLPDQHSVSFGTRRPIWRSTIPEDWQQGITWTEYGEQVTAYAELALNEAKNNISKLVELIDHLTNIPPIVRQQLVDYLRTDAVMDLPEADKLPLWKKLVDLITKHRKYGDAKWAMEPAQVDEISDIAKQLVPSTPFYFHQRLFSESDHLLFEEKGDYAEQRKKLEERRQKALKEVAADGGIEAILRFAESVPSSWIVGIEFGSIAEHDADALILPALLESESKPLVQFAGGYVFSKFRKLSWEWIDSLGIDHWTSTQIGQFLSFLPFVQQAWDRAEAFLGKDQSSYWSKTPANPYEAKQGLEYAVDQLVQYGRPFVAIGCLYRMIDEKLPFENKRAVRVLLEAVKSSKNLNSMDVYETVQIIKALQEDPKTIPQELFKVEWAFLPLLDGHHGVTPRLLWQKLADEQDFFCEVIQLVFRSKKEDATTKDVSEERKSIATNAYRLLDDWHIPPGLGANGVFDGEKFISWLENAREKCKETGHLEVAMTMIGHVLIYVPNDPDGLWIHRSVAEVLNAKDTKDLREGFRSELYNSRGVHFVDRTGKEERGLASKYHGQAEEIENAGYPRIAKMLRELAEEYEFEARRMATEEMMDE